MMMMSISTSRRDSHETLFIDRMWLCLYCVVMTRMRSSMPTFERAISPHLRNFLFWILSCRSVETELQLKKRTSGMSRSEVGVGKRTWKEEGRLTR